MNRPKIERDLSGNYSHRDHSELLFLPKSTGIKITRDIYGTIAIYLWYYGIYRHASTGRGFIQLICIQRRWISVCYSYKERGESWKLFANGCEPPRQDVNIHRT